MTTAVRPRPGGRLRIHTTAVTLDGDFARTHPALSPGPFLRIDVSDTGQGMDAATVAHIFEPFYRGKSAQAAQIHGAGLGLSLARDIAEGMGGRLDASSEPKRGSTFTLELPAAAAEALPRTA